MGQKYKTVLAHRGVNIQVLSPAKVYQLGYRIGHVEFKTITFNTVQAAVDYIDELLKK